MTTRKMRLGAFLQPTGHHVAGWRHSGGFAGMGQDLALYAQLARTAERGLFDLIFVGDTAAVWGTNTDALSRMGRSHFFEPLTLLAALSTATERLGLVATASTTYNHPVQIARKFGSLDHLSSGRAAWNIVTTTNKMEALNFGFDAHPRHADRYRRAHEFVEVTLGLWDSWADDALACDTESGLFFDPEKLHVLNHEGEHFRVRGPLNQGRPPQGHPVLVQAGSSDDGRGLAARFAEVIFAAQNDLTVATEFRMDMHARLAQAGRAPRSALIMPGIYPVIGESRAEAEEKLDELQSLVHPAVALQVLGDAAGGIDLSGYDIDGPFPDIQDDNYKSRLALATKIAREENLTIRQLALKLSVSRGHRTIVGTARDVADGLQEWFEAGAADGFNILPPYYPDGLDRFVTGVIPELQRRGLFRTAYEGRTLRENLGLERPENRFFHKESA